MKRDFNLIRAILLNLEKGWAFERTAYFEEIWGFDFFHEHLRYLNESCYIELGKLLNGPPKRITDKGQELLSFIKNDDIFKAAMSELEELESNSIELLIDLCKQSLRNKLHLIE